MARLIPNESTWIGFASTIANATTTLIPTTGNISAGTCIDLTSFVVSLNATSQGNTVPTPNFDSLFETSTPGTVTAQFTADFYRDDETDTAWDTLPRETKGFFIISRFGAAAGSATKPTTGDKVEVWPVTITSRTMQNMSSNQVLMFSVTCAVTKEPNESATITAT